ncbi:MAG: hypothetical protein AAF430_24300 [Myxococcota bacterium]
MSVRVAAACIALLAFGCGPKLDAAWAAAHLRAAATSASEGGGRPAVVPVWAASEEAAWGRVVRAQTEEPLDESRALTALFDEADGAAVEAWVGGPHAPLNDQVLLDALRFTRRARVPGAHVVFVSPVPPGEDLEAMLEERGVRWSHTLWTATPEDPAPGE